MKQSIDFLFWFCVSLWVIRQCFAVYVSIKTVNRVHAMNNADIDSMNSLSQRAIVADKCGSRWKQYDAVPLWRKVLFLWENPRNWYKGCEFDIFAKKKN